MVSGWFSSLYAFTWLAIFLSGDARIDAQSANITLGTKLLPTQTSGWKSSNGTFKVGFYSAGSDNVFSVGIMYNSIAKQTVVWTAGRNAQVAGPNAAFELTSDGNLVLSNNSGSPAWSSNTSSLGVTRASILDEGNLALYNKSGIVVWQSFDTPTDTLVNGQQLPIGGILQAEGSQYTAVMETGGNLSLTWSNFSYWSSNTASGSANNTPTYASLQGDNFELLNDQGSVKTWRSSDYTDSSVTLRRLTLDDDGNLRIYSWSSASADWGVGWQALQDQCEVYGYCGPNGLCTYNTTGPTCVCPEDAGYVLIDAGNPRNGCRPPSSFVPNCTTIATMVVHNHALLFRGTSFTNINAGDDVCQQTCLKNPVCYAATFSDDGSGVCVLINSGLFSGYQELGLAGSAFFKLCGAAPPVSSPPSLSATSSSSSSEVVPVIVSILGTLATVVMLQAAVLWYCRRKNVSLFGSYSAQYALLEYASGAPIQFSYKDLQKATHGFSEKLGEGGFGAVYKGLLPNNTEVAVKQLEGIDQGEKQFRMEVAIIGSTHHMNLVRLCGFCAQSKHRLLVYEFLRNGSLDKYLFDGSESAPNLDWETRFNVLLGTARGISYLHQECRDSIVHCDIKPENILLDQNFCAKVSDFGLAKLTNPKDRGRLVTTVRGTRGYLAPEWRSNLPITAKSDVFSFGVVVLETVSGRRNFDTSITSSERKSFSEWAFHEYFENNRLEGIVDRRLRSNVNWEELDRALKVAFWCMQVQPSSRPSMSRVIQMLEGTTFVSEPPKPKSFGELPSEEAQMVELLEEESAAVPKMEDESSSSSDPLFTGSGVMGLPSITHTTSLVVKPKQTLAIHEKRAGGFSFS